MEKNIINKIIKKIIVIMNVWLSCVLKILNSSSIGLFSGFSGMKAGLYPVSLCVLQTDVSVALSSVE